MLDLKGITPFTIVINFIHCNMKRKKNMQQQMGTSMTMNLAISG